MASHITVNDIREYEMFAQKLHVCVLCIHAHTYSHYTYSLLLMIERTCYCAMASNILRVGVFYGFFHSPPYIYV